MRAQVKPSGETLSSWLVRYCEPCTEPSEHVLYANEIISHYIVCVWIGSKGAQAHICTTMNDFTSCILYRPDWVRKTMWFWCPAEIARDIINRGN